MTDEWNSIWRRRLAITRARREKVAEAMDEYDKQVHDPAMKALRAECAERGHQWFFYNLGPLGDPWFSCSICGAAEMRRECR